MIDNKYLFKLGFTKLTDLIWQAQRRVFYSYPSLHPEVGEMFKRKAENSNNIDFRIIIDPSEKNFRHGYGDISALDKIRHTNVKIYEIVNNIISFLIVDDDGFFIFPESRIFEEDGISINAARLSKIEILKIINYFFPPITIEEKNEFVNFTYDSHAEIQHELDQIVSDVEKGNQILPIHSLDEKKLEQVRKNLEVNPPLEPDLKRHIEVYTAKIQFVELSFTGVKFDVKKIPIPIEALPIKDERLIKILETKIKLFENLRNDNALWELKWINQQVNDLRNTHTVPMKKRNKRVIIFSRKSDFLLRVNELKQKVINLKIDAEKLFDTEINKAKKALSDTLTNYFKDSKPDFIQDENKIIGFVEYLISQINFPTALSFKEQIKLEFRM